MSGLSPVGGKRAILKMAVFLVKVHGPGRVDARR
jgi:hypothetical protein